MKQFKQAIARRLAEIAPLDAAQAAEKIAAPPKPEMGDLAFGCFALAKELRKAPPAIAADLAARWGEGAWGVASAEAAGPYLNFRLDEKALAEAVAQDAARAKSGEWVASAAGEGAKKPVVTIDFSSPNIAKQFGVPHLRSTATGWSLKRLHDFAGWQAIGINHIGDWGTQFGMLIHAFRERGDEAQLEKEPIRYLHELYIEINEEIEKNPPLKDKARAAFLELEEGKPEAVRLWKLFRDLSLREFNRIYDLLKVRFERVEGEAFYNDKMEGLFDRFMESGIAKQDSGAWIVDTGGAGGIEAPLLLKKSDSGTTYAMRDLAAVDYRRKTYDFAKNLYVVDARQGPHFAQVFAAYAKLGEEEAKIAERCHHVSFGTVYIDGQIGRARKGTILLLDAYLRDLAAKVLGIINEKNPTLEGKEQTAMDVAIGAVVFEMLKKERRHDVHFSSEESIKTEGETGPRIQFLHARLCAIRRTFAETFGREPGWDADAFDEALRAPESRQLMLTALKFEDALNRALADLGPHHIAQYLLDLADAFNQFWLKVRVVEPGDEGGSARRMVLIEHLRALAGRALWLLGMPAPERM
jgi:arginyl-tRNA synthetase